MSVKKKLIVMFTALIAFTCTVAAQDQTQGQPEKTIKHVPVKSTSPVSGKDMYATYCAVCHGTEGIGGWPWATALKFRPTDLPLLSRSSGGNYPSIKVRFPIRNEAN